MKRADTSSRLSFKGRTECEASPQPLIRGFPGCMSPLRQTLRIFFSQDLEDREVIGIKDDMGHILEFRHQECLAHHRANIFRR